MTNVTKTDLIASIALKKSLPKQTVQTVLDGVLEEIGACTNAGAKVTLTGFGKFEMKESAARLGRNPATGEPIEIPASRRLTFKASKSKA